MPPCSVQRQSVCGGIKGEATGIQFNFPSRNLPVANIHIEIDLKGKPV